MFTIALFTISRIWKQPKCLSRDGVDKDVIHTQTHTHRQIHTHTLSRVLLRNKRIKFFHPQQYGWT